MFAGPAPLPVGGIQPGHRGAELSRVSWHMLEDQEATVGDAAVAAPILGRAGAVAGAIGVVGAAERLLAPAARSELARAVTEAARAISRDLGAARGGVVLSALS